MSPALCADAVAIVAGATKLEASGGISIENAKAYAESGVNYMLLVHLPIALQYWISV
jgi:nicotinate-nucleotide pyrophosphorylase (carboxylating)